MYDFLVSVELYNFLRGPMVWVSFIVLIAGSMLKLIFLISKAVNTKVIYSYLSIKYSFRSLFHWLVPFASTNMRKHPWLTIIAFVFHVCLILTPLVTYAHNKLWNDSWGIHLWSAPETVVDILTFTVIICIVFFALRRLITPEVRFVTSYSDFILLTIIAIPFITGLLAYRQLFFDYRVMLSIHILSAEIMLMSIPFTRLSHMLFFWFTRAYTGSDFGAVRHSKDY